ncbi:exodeoxyribonuclease I [Ningiella sp. W23]|uniref:exodeoxyribonuclease I n=1 Tax=Ningiella sp. W23 TaxID=3023715 RepID=UPI003757AA7B
MSASILWHDYETWGVRPAYDFPVQFAAIRTDLDLNIIEKPLNYFCQIPNDYLPHPGACLVTGITPQQSLRDGSIEAEFAKQIYREISTPETCTAGYNSIKFDEEVTRHLLYRNFYPVYEREYSDGNSRWDIIDLVRAAYALRPEGINWPLYEDDRPCFKLEELSRANDLGHDKAHDALSDVYATIALAKLIKQKQPKLYEFYWQMRNKHKVTEWVNTESKQPFLMVSGYIPSSQGCCAWLMPVCQHPTNSNAILCINLSKDPSAILEHSVEALQDPEIISHLREHRALPIMQLATNKVPFVAPAKMLTQASAERLGIDREQSLQNYHRLKQAPQLEEKCINFFTNQYPQDREMDLDAQLYARDFPSPADKKLMNEIRSASEHFLYSVYERLEPSLYRQQLFRYLGRNFPTVLGESDVQKWQRHRHERIVNGANGSCLSLSEFQQQIETLAMQYSQDNNKLSLLKQLEAYASSL